MVASPSKKFPKKGLGRSFASLIPTDILDEDFDPTSAEDERVSDLRHIALSDIFADKDQPRRHFDELALSELTHSIKEHGVLQPIVVVAKDAGFEIVAGERRFRAAKSAGLKKIPAIIRTLTAQHKLELSLIENIQRRDLNVLETATAYLKLRDQFSLSLEQISVRVGKSLSAVSNTLRLLRLPDFVKQELAKNTLREGQVRSLIGLDEKILRGVLPKIISENWSARRVESYVANLKNTPKQKDQKYEISQKKYQADREYFAKKYEAKVAIRAAKNGAGKIEISFKNAEEFDRLKKILS